MRCRNPSPPRRLRFAELDGGTVPCPTDAPNFASRILPAGSSAPMARVQRRVSGNPASIRHARVPIPAGRCRGSSARSSTTLRESSTDPAARIERRMDLTWARIETALLEGRRKTRRRQEEGYGSAEAERPLRRELSEHQPHRDGADILALSVAIVLCFRYTGAFERVGKRQVGRGSAGGSSLSVGEAPHATGRLIRSTICVTMYHIHMKGGRYVQLDDDGEARRQ